MFDIFKKYNVIAAVSERRDGSMKVYADSSEEDGVKENRKIFLDGLGVEMENSVTAYLTHGDSIALVGKGDGGKFFDTTDGFVTKDKDVFLTVTVSDCLPVFLFDPEAEVLGLAHAGWGGLEKGIISKAVGMMKESGATAENILVAIGPGMEKCHYEVGSELADKFAHIPGSFEVRDRKIFLDTKAIAKHQLLEEGIAAGNIETSPECTFREKEKYFSYRRDSYGRPEKLEAMMAIFGMRS
ncbi:MAG: Multi-copper polyphenol oxidoreductase, laccase [Candidatus Moranbacteria bacterium GW2011_GWE1_49_15]|nr:MAG: Multi-copper polyphenol oxidoreductase, laccase [Candidatus Moranbacteria bacterium GW2011_GWE2_47_10]KKW06968.1 MAG: Multi-copper polyphenol oxidoreductase, laccase [Candidatus Moranbacteria bacterium GW2011_GWE1_49_15]HBP01388.1 peptidoglycan editing factor PgeF [Candidatus Moranbacteria bacterium]